jgi:hypothetical protein
MTRICYVKKKFSAGSADLIQKANSVVADYAEQGLDLTLRQVYYQFVSRGWIANNQREYKRLGSIVNDARLAGMISWDAIEDRTRTLRSRSHWNNPHELVDAAAKQYTIDLWATQDFYVEVWIEKDALVGVLDAICPQNDVPYFSCRGYTSQSEMWSAAMRLNRAARPTKENPRGRTPIVIHLGDHDPSGVDMSRDIRDRLNLFSRAKFTGRPPFDPEWKPSEIEVRRIALTMDQIQEFNPPPNPAKITDARARGYIEEYGDESWELDALEPRTMIDLIRGQIEEFVDEKRWKRAVEKQSAGRSDISRVAEILRGEKP